MVARHSPPGLTSIEIVDSGTSVPRPPHQSENDSGSVHALNTSSRGASNVRVIVMPSLVAGASVISGSLLDVSQVLVEAVEAPFPQLAVALEPVERLLHWFAEPARG